jgi:hypothetical protein
LFVWGHPNVSYVRCQRLGNKLRGAEALWIPFQDSTSILDTLIGGSVAYVIMVMDAPILDTRTHVDGMTLLTGKE